MGRWRSDAQYVWGDIELGTEGGVLPVFGPDLWGEIVLRKLKMTAWDMRFPLNPGSCRMHSIALRLCSRRDLGSAYYKWEFGKAHLGDFGLRTGRGWRIFLILVSSSRPPTLAPQHDST